MTSFYSFLRTIAMTIQDSNLPSASPLNNAHFIDHLASIIDFGALGTITEIVTAS
jgi:hypothetical protein